MAVDKMVKRKIPPENCFFRVLARAHGATSAYKYPRTLREHLCPLPSFIARGTRVGVKLRKSKRWLTEKRTQQSRHLDCVPGLHEAVRMRTWYGIQD